MIYFVEGTLISKELTRAVVNVQGVGYEVFITLGGYDGLPQLGKKVLLHTFHHVREDAQHLFGFLDEKERDFFKLLISVSGVGPKVAISILGAILLSDLRRAIFTEDSSRLNSLPGIGKKTAERIILELKGKVQPTGEEGKISISKNSGDGELWDEALMALISLGYNQAIAQNALKQTLQKHKETQTVEGLVRKSLNYV